MNTDIVPLRGMPAASRSTRCRRVMKALTVLSLIAAVAVLVGATSAKALPCRGQYKAQYYESISLTDLGKTRCEAAPLDHDYGSGLISPLSLADNVSARWTGTFAFDAADYRFDARADDGVRVYVDGVPLIDEWRDQSATAFTKTEPLSAGRHQVKVEWYEKTGDAVINVTWTKVGVPSDTTPPDTVIDSGPGSGVADGNATFAFHATEEGSTFECQMDDAVPDSDCTSPKSYSGLAAGDHTFAVWATDGAGNIDASPATNTFTVPTSPPPSNCPNSAPTGYVTVSGAPNDEVSSGQNVYFPAGSYNSGATTTMNLANGQKVSGAGRDAVTVTGSGFDLANNNVVECIGLVSGGATYDTAYSFNHLGGIQSGSVVRNTRMTNYHNGVQSSEYSQLEFIGNESINTSYTFYRVFGPGTVARGNYIDMKELSGYEAGFEIAGSSGITIEDNIIKGGVAGIKGLAGYSVAPRATRDVVVRNNRVSGFSEEGISTDVRGNSATDNAVREMDRISSVSNNTVRLQGAYTSSPYGNGHHYLSVYSGACRGLTYRITAQNLSNFTLESAPTCVPAAGDRVIVGVPAINWQIETNYVDASQGLTAIHFWGLTFNSSVVGNTTIAPPPATNYGGDADIGLISLQGVSGGGQITTGGAYSANVDNIYVADNKIGSTTPRARDILLIANVSWADCNNFYRPRLNTYVGNEQPLVQEDNC
jgi:PA14 domain